MSSHLNLFMKNFLFILAIFLLFGCFNQQLKEQNFTNNSTNLPVNSTPIPNTTNNTDNDTIYGPPSNYTPVINDTNTSNDTVQPQPINYSELLDDAMDKLTNDFYANHSGRIQQTKYFWIQSSSSNDGSIALSSGPIKFDNKTITSLQASGVVLFEFTPLNGGTTRNFVYGTAIMNQNTSPLDDYGFSEEFTVDYYSQLINKKLTDCVIYGRDYTIQKDNAVTYFFRCQKSEELD